jgi:predicted NAD-dependent protein-ADP-ribosyltransferase YbiA (DUF1768 family)
MPQDAKAQVIKVLDRGMPAAVVALSEKPAASRTLGLKVECNRWIWNENRSGVIIENYLKDINLNTKRILHRDGSTEPVKDYHMTLFH